MGYEEIIKSIVLQQELIIGPVAVEEANKVLGLNVSQDGKVVRIEGDGKSVLENLVKQYASLFGRVSIEVCKEAAMSVTKTVPAESLPDILK
ncbi:hypothetical protein HY419_00590 [candidate division WWE3 bacterium]|nr:hypothetical protein [candidate division WWE3 bacterium]